MTDAPVPRSPSRGLFVTGVCTTALAAATTVALPGTAHADTVVTTNRTGNRQRLLPLVLDGRARDGLHDPGRRRYLPDLLERHRELRLRQGLVHRLPQDGEVLRLLQPVRQRLPLVPFRGTGADQARPR